MTKNKNNQTIWNTRIKNNSSNLSQKIGSSIDIDKRLYKEDIMGSIVHVEMLFKQKIISFKIKNKIVYGLNKIEKEIFKNKFEFNRKYEDIHMNIEKRLFQIIGEDAGYIHTARSRNDQVITHLKMWLKKANNEVNYNLNQIIKSTLKIAEKNIFTIMPGFTHLKNAQAISLAHYLMAYVEMFTRDKKRFENSLESLNENPLGVAAFTGTSFNIDRNYTTKKLGFKNPTNNSIDTVSDRDFAIDFLYSSAVCAMHLSRLAEDFIILNSDAYDPTRPECTGVFSGPDRYAICYNIGKGKTFNKILNTYIPFKDYMENVESMGSQGNNDELYYGKMVNSQTDVTVHKIKRGYCTDFWAPNRLEKFHFKQKDLPHNLSVLGHIDISSFIDCHCPTPFETYESLIYKIKNLILQH